MQVKGYKVEKIPHKDHIIKELSITSSSCRGIFCKNKEQHFLKGLIDAITKFKEADKLSRPSATMNFIYSRYLLELEEGRLN